MNVNCRLTLPLRNPYQIKRLPWLAKLYRRVFDFNSLSEARLYANRKKWSHLLVKWLFLYWPCKLRGSFVYNNQPCSFNVFNTQFHAIYFHRFQFSYEPEITALIDRLLTSSSVFYDIGSNWGYYCGYVASFPAFSGHIHAFEPNTHCLEDLHKFIDEAKLGECTSVHACALSDDVTESTLSLPDAWHSGLGNISLCNMSGQRVKILTLDSMRIQPPDMIKCDAEGSDLYILLGAMDMIGKYRPIIIFEWFFRQTKERLFEMLLGKFDGLEYEALTISRDSLSDSEVTVELNNLSSIDHDRKGKRHILLIPTEKLHAAFPKINSSLET